MIDMDNIIIENSLNNDNLKKLMKDYEFNKFNLDEKINGFFEEINKILNNKKLEICEQLNFFYNKNYEKISEKLELLNTRIENSKDYKERIISIMNGNLFELEETLGEYNNIIRFYTDNSNVINFEIEEVNFIHEEENKIHKNILNICDIKLRNKFIKFQKTLNLTNKTNKLNKRELNNFDKLLEVNEFQTDLYQNYFSGNNPVFADNLYKHIKIVDKMQNKNQEILETSDLINDVDTRNKFYKQEKFKKKDDFFKNESRILYKYEGGERKNSYENPNDQTNYLI